MNLTTYRNRKTLFLGEVNSGKTTRTRGYPRLPQEGEEGIALFDFAPEKVGEVGGKISLDEEDRCRVWVESPRIVPPRLTAKTEAEAWRLARENFQRIEEAFDHLPGREWSLFVGNDVSLYLQAGRADRLLARLEFAATVVLNGYYGGYFGDSPLSRREREQMDLLKDACHQVFLSAFPLIHLNLIPKGKEQKPMNRGPNDS